MLNKVTIPITSHSHSMAGARGVPTPSHNFLDTVKSSSHHRSQLGAIQSSDNYVLRPNCGANIRSTISSDEAQTS